MYEIIERIENIKLKTIFKFIDEVARLLGYACIVGYIMWSIFGDS